MTRMNDRSIFVKSSTEDIEGARIRDPVSDGSRGFQISKRVGTCDFCPTVCEFSAFVRRVYRPHGGWLADCDGERRTSGEKCGVLRPWENISTSLGRLYPNHHNHHHPLQPVAPQVRRATRWWRKDPVLSLPSSNPVYGGNGYGWLLNAIRARRRLRGHYDHVCR